MGTVCIELKTDSHFWLVLIVCRFPIHVLMMKWTQRVAANVIYLQLNACHCNKIIYPEWIDNSFWKLLKFCFNENQLTVTGVMKNDVEW